MPWLAALAAAESRAFMRRLRAREERLAHGRDWVVVCALVERQIARFVSVQNCSGCAAASRTALRAEVPRWLAVRWPTEAA